MKKQGAGIRGWAQGITVGLGFLRMLSLTASAETQPESAAENLRITVRIYQFAQIPDDTLSQAEMTASRVFREAGIELDWLDCPIKSAEPGQNPACRESSPTMLRMRIMPPATPQARTFLSDDALGFAVTLARPEHGYLASVYYDRACQRAEKLGHHSWQILGFAIAHEIGHLLLGSNSHAPSGLMRGKWDKHAMAWGVRGALVLSPEEAATIRTEVRARKDASRAWGQLTRSNATSKSRS